MLSLLPIVQKTIDNIASIWQIKLQLIKMFSTNPNCLSSGIVTYILLVALSQLSATFGAPMESTVHSQTIDTLAKNSTKNLKPASWKNDSTFYKRRTKRNIYPEPPLLWKENCTISGSHHNQNLTRVYLNATNFVAVYFDPDLNPNATWLFDFTSEVWAYMTQTYGDFGPDPYISLILHQGKYKGGHRGHSLFVKENLCYDKRNIIDQSSLRPNAWYNYNCTTMGEEMDLIMRHLAYFVEFSSKERRGSPAFDVWKGRLHDYTAWVDIFTYDIYNTLNFTKQAYRIKNNKLTKSDSYPKKFTFWFKDWFLPIYENFGGNQVLNEYFSILRDHYPQKVGVYLQPMDLGNFIHFWSGAAKSNLEELALNAFGWNDTYQKQLKDARIQFPGVYQMYAGKTVRFGVENSMHQQSGGAIIGVSVAVAVFILISAIAIVGLIFYKQKTLKLQNKIRCLTKEEVKEFLDGTASTANRVSAYSSGTTSNADSFGNDLVQSMPFVQDFEIPRDQIILAHDRLIGSGEYGSVIHGFVRLAEHNQLLSVAIKTVKPDVDILSFKLMLSEVKIIAYLGRHENIVGLVGTCTANIKNREIFIVMELCSLGNLHDYLRKNREYFQSTSRYENSSCDTVWFSDSSLSSSEPEVAMHKITVFDLVEWSQEISNGMMYLTEKKVIHGDLAARNILLTANRVAKLSDFGLSRQLLNYEHYMKKSKTPVPWKWLAIECLKERKFSVASDVWSFGVTMWEIFSLGEIPYAGWTYDFQFVNRLVTGDRLGCPPYASEELYQLMLDCWSVEPNVRPSFEQIYKVFEEINSKPFRFLVKAALDLEADSSKDDILYSTLIECESCL